MIHVLLAALCSVLVSVLLKLARRFDIDVGQAVAWNYVATGALTLLVLQPSLQPLRQADAPWLTLAALGLLLPTIFLALAASVHHAGIVRSDAAQRLSLLIPLLAAFTLFGEALAPLKLAGCALGLLALAGMVWRDGRDAGGNGVARWGWPLAVFAGFGLIDVLFKRVAGGGLPLGSALLAVFALALLVDFALQLFRRVRFTMRSALGGLLLGAVNFANILFYLRAHRALPDSPSLVFASMNLGVVALGAVAGVALFRERLSRINAAGLLLALTAIALLALG
ncbi:EamA/RhaT family transporter [Thermomonas fusca]|uniref:EamA/RhaT family transporter n=1 Tax=Thermomonas fusca TaxID=215690 RepID=A0A5R9PH49_9GAMM|nr:EamA/RhaT family transporter [Thermomonas fusca]TLX22536.1 EamA/RhaT family transporter [Thermomonas fusca]